MQPNGNVIVDTICRTAKLGTTITGATENGDVTVIEGYRRKRGALDGVSWV